MPGGKALVAFTSAEAHYSYAKAANLMGLGTENLVKVPCDPVTGAMDPEALDALLTAEAAKGERLPFFVGSTAGSTVLGAFDPFPALRAVCDKHGVWLHVDGAWGGSAIVSPSLRPQLLAGAELADSFCWNPHKALGAPLQTTVFCAAAAHAGLLRNANSANAAYLFQPDKNFGELDLGDTTLQCGRRADAMKLWLMWKALGDQGMAKRVETNVALCTYMAEQVRSRTDAQGRRCFLLTSKPQFANLCFYLVPPSLREAASPPLVENTEELAADDHTLLTDAQVAALGKVSAVVKDRMQRHGKALIGFQPVATASGRSLSNCWRMVVAGAREQPSAGYTPAYVDAMLDDMLALAEDL